MHKVSVFQKLFTSGVLSAAFLFSIALTPSHAAAQSASSIQTQQLLPPGQNTCQQISITNIDPHVYGGVLESFDVTISDTNNSYVGVFAEVGNNPIPLNFITRWAGAPNGLRIHVDTPDTPVYGSLPVNLTLLSSLPGAPTCITTITFTVGKGSLGQQPATSNNTIPSSVPHTTPTQATRGSSSGSAVGTGKGQSSTVGAQGSSSTALLGSTVASAGSANFFSAMCTGSNAYRLWFVLLIIYIIIVAIVVFAEPWFLESSVIGSTATVLVPLILLLGFWYLSASCRAASWIPVVACVIAIIGLFLAFREYELPPLLPAPSEQ
ncbi:MAG: hypothetical protein P4L81_00650 [Candidatus Pacebacteria bacterium]|nr:hypothetical protein [Candidatus Paceibacterota bacterium]